jgi:hypothetical protein
MHISVHYNYNGELPTKLPEFEIKYKGSFAKSYHFIQKKLVESAESIKIEQVMIKEIKDKFLKIEKILNPKEILSRINNITNGFRQNNYNELNETSPIINKI